MKLLCGDCFELIKNIPDKTIDLIVTDPPYDISLGGGGFCEEKNIKHANERQLEKISKGFDFEILREFIRVMKRINLYIFCSHKQIIPLLDYFVEKRNCNYVIITWHKTNPLPTCNNTYLKDTEYCLFFREKGVELYGDFSTKSTWYLTPINQKDKALYKHPTIKPLQIIQNFILNSSCPGDIILDPFMGSGTTGVACSRLKREFIGMEIEKEYFAIAEKRINAENEYLTLF